MACGKFVQRWCSCRLVCVTKWSDFWKSCILSAGVTEWTKIVPVPVMQRRSCFLQYFLELCGGDIKLRGALLRAPIRHEFVCLCFRLWYPRTQICFTSVSRGVGDICTSASVCSLRHDDTLLMSVQTMTNTLFEARYFLTQPGKKSGAWPKTYQGGLHF